MKKKKEMGKKESFSLHEARFAIERLQFDQAHLGLDRDYYLDRAKYGEKIEAYKQFLINQSTPIVQVAIERLKQDVDEIIKFETKIAKIMVAKEDRKNYTRMYNLRRLNDMDKLTPMVSRAF
ncbi:hypothetical protein COOONC_07151 [Cooperia oncophora]